MNPEEQGKKMSQLVAKCWSDENFKRKLLADPAQTLRAEGLELPTGLTIKAVENDDKVFHVVIPAKPTDLSDEDLDRVSGGEVPCDQCISYRCFCPGTNCYKGCEPNSCRGYTWVGPR